jgi:hypothetical protein
MTEDTKLMDVKTDPAGFGGQLHLFIPHPGHGAILSRIFPPAARTGEDASDGESMNW